MKEASGTTSSYLRETFTFLEETFANLRELKMSEQLISDAIFATYQHIGFSLLEKLIDERNSSFKSWNKVNGPANFLVVGYLISDGKMNC